MHNTLKDVIPLFEHQHQVDIHYFHDPMNMSYKISMRLGDRAIMEQVSEFDMLSYGEALDVLIAMHYELLHQEIKPPEPEIVEPKETPPPTNCPNCGAVVTSRKCEYCGTIHWGFEEAEAEPLRCNDLGYFERRESISQLNRHLIDNIAKSEYLTTNEAREMLGFTVIPEKPLLTTDEAGKAQLMYYGTSGMPFGAKKPEQSPGIVIEPNHNKLKKIFKRRKK